MDEDVGNELRCGLGCLKGGWFKNEEWEAVDLGGVEEGMVLLSWELIDGG